MSTPAPFDTTTAHPARRYNYWLGGKDNFAADRASGDAIQAAMPGIRLMALENRMFLGRAVRFLAEQGIDQFLDIGTGIPAPGNTHEVAQRVTPSARVVYVDNDPLVLAHARALMTSGPVGETAYLDADLRDPAGILDHPDLAATIDLRRPVGLLLIAVIHFVRDDEGAASVVQRLVDALAPGSYLAITQATWEYQSPESIEKLSAANADGRFAPRGGDELLALLPPGLELVDPGLVSVSRWRSDDAPQPRPAVEDVACNGLVARKA
jgi:hypothetical protein